MKNKLLVLVAMFALFGLALVAYAYTTTDTGKAKACCCSKSDHKSSGEHAGKSCPMNNHDSAQAATEGACCCCSGDACPMKQKGEAKVTADSVSAQGESCCANCDCCSGKHEKAD